MYEYGRGCSSSSSEDSIGVMFGVRNGFDKLRGDCEKRSVCLTVGEVRNGSARDLYILSACGPQNFKLKLTTFAVLSDCHN